MYLLNMQNRYDGSDCKWHRKGRNDVQPEGAERVRWSDCKWHGKERNDILSEGAEQVRPVRVANGTTTREMTYLLKVQSRYDQSGREWDDNARNDVPPEGAEQVRCVTS